MIHNYRNNGDERKRAYAMGLCGSRAAGPSDDDAKSVTSVVPSQDSGGGLTEARLKEMYRQDSDYMEATGYGAVAMFCGGDAAKRLDDDCHSSDDDDDDGDVDSVASSIDIIKPTYVRALSERLGARSKTLGHNAVAVNAFIASRTDGRVNRIVDDDVLNDADGRILLLVAACVRGVRWRVPGFHKNASKPGVFRTGPNDEDIQACVMMRAKLKTPHVVMWDKSEAVALEYGGGGDGGSATSAATSTRAVLYLPPTNEASHVIEGDGGGDWSSAIDAARAMTPGKWSSISARVSQPDARRDVDVSVPKFTVSAGPMSLEPALRSIGLNAVFDRPGGLTALSDDEEMTIREVIHEVVVDVDEGEEPDDDSHAAAAGESKPSRTPRTRVVFDRPFLFFIEDARSRALLFAGVVNAPGVVV